MNKERKATLTLAADILEASVADGAYSRRMSRAVESGIKELIASEDRARRAMEGFKDLEGTAQNYRNTVSSLKHLEASMECLVEDDYDGALEHLRKAADPVAQQVHREVKTKARRARK